MKPDKPLRWDKRIYFLDQGGFSGGHQSEKNWGGIRANVPNGPFSLRFLAEISEIDYFLLGGDVFYPEIGNLEGSLLCQRSRAVPLIGEFHRQICSIV